MICECFFGWGSRWLCVLASEKSQDFAWIQTSLKMLAFSRQIKTIAVGGLRGRTCYTSRASAKTLLLSTKIAQKGDVERVWMKRCACWFKILYFRGYTRNISTRQSKLWNRRGHKCARFGIIKPLALSGHLHDIPNSNVPCHSSQVLLTKLCMYIGEEIENRWSQRQTIDSS